MLIKGKTISLIFWLLLTTTIVIVNAWMYWLATEAPAQQEVQQVGRNLDLHLQKLNSDLSWVSSNPGMVTLSLPPSVDFRLVFDRQDIVTFQSRWGDESKSNDLMATLVGFLKLPRQTDLGVFYWRENVMHLSVYEHGDEFSVAGVLLNDWMAVLSDELEYEIFLSASNDGKPIVNKDAAQITMPSLVGKPVYMRANTSDASAAEPFPLLISIVLSAAVSGVIIFLFYYRPIWLRLQDIVNQAKAALKTSDFKSRIQYKGSDDIAEMAIQVNAMLSSLEYCYNLMAKTNLITTELMQKVDSQVATPPLNFDSDENELKASLDVVSRLSKALELGKIEIFLQPVYGKDRSTVTSYEALARWLDEELGMVSPREFVALCEKAGLTDQLTTVMIQRAIDALRKIQANKGDAVKVSLNLSTSQFLSPALVGCLSDINANDQMILSNVEFEVKESTITHDFDQVLLLVEKLKALGVGVCIDDYGLGRYSLMYLQRIPVVSIKLSAAFTERLTWESREVAFIDGIARFAAGLGIRVIVKNIETEAQLESLNAGLPIEYQGLGLSPPAPLDAVLA